MKKNSTRLSITIGERRVILILTCIAVIVLTMSFLSVGRAEAAVLSDNPTSVMRTSYNDEYYSVFQTSGTKITAVGCYASDRIRKIYVYNLEDETSLYKISVKGDGSYEAELTVAPSEDCRATLVLKLDSGALLSYIMEFRNGKWGFPDNGLGESSREVFEHIYDMPSAVGEAYLSASGTAEEISTAREQIRLIAEEQTKGLSTDYEKARALAKYVADNFYYDHDAAESAEISTETVALASVLKSCRTICSGFANLYCALLEAVDIDAVNIKGSVTSDEVKYEDLATSVQNHEWAAFYCEDESRWVWVDCCWNGSGDYSGGEYTESVTHEKYFDISDLALSLNHRADKAERRTYFDEEAAEITTSTASTAEEETPQSTVQSSSAQTTTTPQNTENTDISENNNEDNDNTDNNTDGLTYDTVLYIILGVLVAAIAVLAAVIIKNSRNGRNN